MGDGGVAYQMNSFEPGMDNERIFRKALGRFGTGVTVVTANSDRGPIGMTVNSFSSVSMDPPLISWCPAKNSERYVSFKKSTHFAINVLSNRQLEVCDEFARSSEAFSGIGWFLNQQKVPIIEGCIACFECRQYACYDGGDHDIMLGEVTRASISDGDPLLFFGGDFGRFAPFS